MLENSFIIIILTLNTGYGNELICLETVKSFQIESLKIIETIQLSKKDKYRAYVLISSISPCMPSFIIPDAFAFITSSCR